MKSHCEINPSLNLRCTPETKNCENCGFHPAVAEKRHIQTCRKYGLPLPFETIKAED